VKRVRIVVSSGFGVDKCRVMADTRAPNDVAGTQQQRNQAVVGREGSRSPTGRLKSRIAPATFLEFGFRGSLVQNDPSLGFLQSNWIMNRYELLARYRYGMGMPLRAAYDVI
jgi:hypothetical protein